VFHNLFRSSAQRPALQGAAQGARGIAGERIAVPAVAVPADPFAQASVHACEKLTLHSSALHACLVAQAEPAASGGGPRRRGAPRLAPVAGRAAVQAGGRPRNADRGAERAPAGTAGGHEPARAACRACCLSSASCRAILGTACRALGRASAGPSAEPLPGPRHSLLPGPRSSASSQSRSRKGRAGEQWGWGQSWAQGWAQGCARGGVEEEEEEDDAWGPWRARQATPSAEPGPAAGSADAGAAFLPLRPGVRHHEVAAPCNIDQGHSQGAGPSPGLRSKWETCPTIPPRRQSRSVLHCQGR